MTEEVEEQGATGEKPKPTTQHEFNLAAMEAIRHLAEYTAAISKMAGVGAGEAYLAAKSNGNEASAEKIMATGEEVRKAGLRYHNSALDLWEAFAKDAGPDLVTPRELPPRQKVDD